MNTYAAYHVLQMTLDPSGKAAEIEIGVGYGGEAFYTFAPPFGIYSTLYGGLSLSDNGLSLCGGSTVGFGIGLPGSSSGPVIFGGNSSANPLDINFGATGSFAGYTGTADIFGTSPGPLSGGYNGVPNLGDPFYIGLGGNFDSSIPLLTPNGGGLIPTLVADGGFNPTLPVEGSQVSIPSVHDELGYLDPMQTLWEPEICPVDGLELEWSPTLHFEDHDSSLINDLADSVGGVVDDVQNWVDGITSPFDFGGSPSNQGFGGGLSPFFTN